MKLRDVQHAISDSRRLRRAVLRVVIFSLLVTAALGITAVLGGSFGETDISILGSAALIDAASLLVLACAGTATSAFHRWIQLTGILAAFAGLVSGLSFIWFAPDEPTGGLEIGILRATGVVVILAIVAAHASVVLSWRSSGRLTGIVVPGTLLCTAVAGELIANYAAVPGFSPGTGYNNAIEIALILGVLGTILALLVRRFGPRRSEQRPSEVSPSEGHSPEAHGPEAHSPEAHSPETHSPETHSPEAHSPEAREISGSRAHND
jgi:hypothetical protein